MIIDSTYPLDVLQTNILDTYPARISVCRQESELVYRAVWANKWLLEQTGLFNIIGKVVSELLPPDESDRTIEHLRQCCSTGQPVITEAAFTMPVGQIWSRTTYLLLASHPGAPPHILMVSEDITEMKLREQEEREQQEMVIAQQQATLAELSTPLLAISDTTV